MRIGMMLRTIDERGGIGVYTNNLIQELLNVDGKNHYVLFYRNPDHVGRFAHFRNVTERVVRGSNKAYWDQIAIPLACWREKVDLLFHPKFTAPLLAPCKTVMVVHGADWFMPEQAQYYSWLDTRYIRAFMPLYFKKCDVVISVSQLTTDNFYQVLKLPPGKIKTVYVGVGRHFKRIEDEAERRRVRERYNLPDRFILTLTKRGGGDRRKNFGRILEAYARYYAQTNEPYPWVVAGKDCHLFRDEYGIPNHGYGQDILFPGWVEQKDLPAVYSMAELVVHPSNLEAFPQPVVEAMACGTPLITSNANGLKEIAGDAALFVDPQDSVAIAGAIEQMLADEQLRVCLPAKGLKRAKQFTWEKCAQETLAIIEETATPKRRGIYV